MLKLLRQSFTGKYQPHGQLSQADCVIGFSFGYRGDWRGVTPGPSNRSLAVLAEQIKLPQILQHEIADVLPVANLRQPVIHRIDRHREDGRYLDTREVAFQAAQIMRSREWGGAIILAHPNHLPRVAAVCRKLGIEPVILPGLVASVPWDKESAHWQTRGAWRWRLYDLAACASYNRRGWI